MSVSEKPPLSPLLKEEQVRAVLEAVDALTADKVLELRPDLAELPPEVKFVNLDTSPDTIFATPDGKRFEAAATAYLALTLGRGREKKLTTTESISAVVKGSLTPIGANVDEIKMDASELFEAR